MQSEVDRESVSVPMVKAPLHFRIISSVLLAWLALLVAAFVGTEVGSTWLLSKLPPETMPMVASLPWWARVARTFGFIAGMAGAILLFLRSRHAFLGFVGLLCALALGTLGEQIIGLPESLRSGHMLVAKFGNWILAIGTVCYAHWMRVTGVLR